MKLKEEMEREKRRGQVTPAPSIVPNLTGKWTASCNLLPEGRRQTFEVTINQNGDRFTPQAAQYNFTGKVTTTVQRMGNWQSEPLDGVEVFVGKDLWIESTPAGDFVRNAKNIVATTTTDSRGEFRLNIPPGQYTVVLWKRGFLPHFGPVSIPGSYKGNLQYGNPSGMYPHSSLGFKDN